MPPSEETRKDSPGDENQEIRAKLSALQDTVESLQQLEWLLSASGAMEEEYRFGVPLDDGYTGQGYGDLVALNTKRTIADGVGPAILQKIAGDYLDLLGTSGAIYETNGDYALGIFSSGWCRLMDQTSRGLCKTSDDSEALRSGKWHCHESCWSSSRASIETGKPVDIACSGGIRLYAVPIAAGGEIVGSVNFGYGDPPRDDETLSRLAEKYGVAAEVLREKAAAYRSRPPVVIELAKKRLQTAAMLIGEIVTRRRTEEKLIALARELKRSNEELEQFAYVASHDLQEPLRAVAGYCKLIKQKNEEDPSRRSLDEESSMFLDKALAGTKRMQELIHDLLVYARAGNEDADPTPVDLGLAVKTAEEHLGHVIAERGAALTVGHLPAVPGSRSQLTQVFQNLLSNALKYCDGRSPKVEISAKDSGRMWTIAVRDNGIGIDPQYYERIFGIFQRLHTRRTYPGTGMGLALCRKVVERHGGQIWVESTPGEGSTFLFTLPKPLS